MNLCHLLSHRRHLSQGRLVPSPREYRTERKEVGLLGATKSRLGSNLAELGPSLSPTGSNTAQFGHVWTQVGLSTGNLVHLALKLGPRQAQCGQHGFTRTPIEAEEKLEIAVKLQNCKFSACRIESSNLVQVGPNLGPAAPRAQQLCAILD